VGEAATSFSPFKALILNSKLGKVLQAYLPTAGLGNQNQAIPYLFFVDFIWFYINSFMRTHGQQLQAAYRQHIEPYSNYVQFAVTLTLKQSAQIVTPYATGKGVYRRYERLDDEKLSSTIRYFNALLRHELFGNKCYHKNKRDWARHLSIFSIEGRNTYKRTHLHAAIGNIPGDKLVTLPAIVESVWKQCDFANREIRLKPVYDSAGWLGYITKEIGYTDTDCLDVCSIEIPPFIEQSICR
jgi:hypothetical protein